MNEERKKISLLTNLYDILFNNFVNNNIFDYKFYSMSNLILNGINFNVSGKIICIILHLDELIIEIYYSDSKYQSCTLPYNLINDIYILLEERHDKKLYF